MTPNPELATRGVESRPDDQDQARREAASLGFPNEARAPSSKPLSSSRLTSRLLS